MVYNNCLKYLLSLTLLLVLPACVTTNKSQDNKVANIESIKDLDQASITRLSFVPTSNPDENIEIVLYQDENNLNDIIPASGEQEEQNDTWVFEPKK